FLHGGPASANAPLIEPFRQGLAEFGYVDGRNVTIEFSWAEGHYDRLGQLTADLVRRQVNRRVQPACGAGRQSSHSHDYDRVRIRQRPCQGRPRRQLQSAGWQRYGNQYPCRRAAWETAGAAARVGTYSFNDRRAPESADARL